MSYILIENKGEIHPDALMLMGGTTKRDSKTSIGFYGSGNKYSIATLLKNKVDFKIFSGEKEIKIESKEYDFRGTKLDKIYIDGKETNLTTTMGPDWEVSWMPLREWLSNAIDEGGLNIITSTDSFQGVEGKTRMYIQLIPAIQQVVNDWDNYFTQDRDDIIYQESNDKLFPNTYSDDSLVLFRRGIRCYVDKSLKSLYHYDLTNFEINESRVISNLYEARKTITIFLNNCTNVRVIKNILLNSCKENRFEKSLPWDSYIIPSKFSKEWREAIGDYRIIAHDMSGWFEAEQQNFNCYIVPTDLAKRIRKLYPDVIVYGILDDGQQEVLKREVELDKRKEFLLKECNRFFDEAGYIVEYPIKVIHFEQAEQLGLAENGTIYVSDKVFEMGKRELAVTIIEENEHLKTGYKDCSRAFQQYFINKYISEMEERIAFFL